MREGATLKLDSGEELRVDVDRDDLEQEEIVVRGATNGGMPLADRLALPVPSTTSVPELDAMLGARLSWHTRQSGMKTPPPGNHPHYRRAEAPPSLGEPPKSSPATRMHVSCRDPGAPRTVSKRSIPRPPAGWAIGRLG